MKSTTLSASIASSTRLHSIDVFRSVTMLLMIFVNDLSGALHIPNWIDHAEADADALGFADTIFPAFLFIVGLSIPLSISFKESKGSSRMQMLWYIIYRSFALVLMGFYQVNMDTYARHHWLPKPVWCLLATLSFFLIWLNYPQNINKVLKNFLIALGYLVLLALAVVYKGNESSESDGTGMQPQWWGILGIIGWSYFITALLFWLSKGHFKFLLLSLALLLAVNISLHTIFDQTRLWVIGDASSLCLTMAGVVTILAYTRNKISFQRVFLATAASGAAAIFLGMLIRPYTGGISKIYSTPAWVLISAGISLIVLSLLIYGIDFKKKHNWFHWIAPAGTSTLTCYLIPYLLFFGMRLFHLSYPESWYEGWGAILRSFGTSLLIIIFVGLLQKLRLTLKL